MFGFFCGYIARERFLLLRVSRCVCGRCFSLGFEREAPSWSIVCERSGFLFFAHVFLSRLLHSAAFPCLSHAAVVPFFCLPLVILQRFSLLSCSWHRFAVDTSFASGIASQTPSLLLVSLLSLTPSSSPLSLFAFRHFWGMLLNYGVEIRS